MRQIDLEYDERTDSLYLAFNDLDWDHQTNLDMRRAVDYDAENAVIGIELLSASTGVVLNGLPYVEDVERVLVARGFPIVQLQAR
jgi:uncharacterized protein YuzE